MANFYDISYAIGLGISSPYWLIKPSARRKVLTALEDRMGEEIPPRIEDGPAILIHAVSLGEMNATRALVQALREARPGLQFIVSATTQTGYERGYELYGQSEDVTLIRYPLDFSGAIERVLEAARPDLVVLMELEVWPNFMLQCQRREIPVVLGNARLTTSSFRNYKRGGAIVRKMFSRLTLVCAQDMTYAERFLALGVPAHRVVITSTMKFDNAPPTGPVAGAEEIAASVGLHPGREPIWVCGSTGPGEEWAILKIYRSLLTRHPRLRLVLVPRHPDRFDRVAGQIEQAHLHCVRRSAPKIPADSPLPPVVLGDTMGELRAFYSMADVVFVGRTLADLGPRQHGSDMIEPAALAKAVVVGPHTNNFAEAMRQFRAADAMLEVKDPEDLEQATSALLSTPSEAAAMARRAAEVVNRERGATARHVRVILQILAAKLGETNQRPAHPGQVVRHVAVQTVAQVAAPMKAEPPKANPFFQGDKPIQARIE